MQIRELDLKELYTVYDVLSQLYTQLTYKEFEDLIYDMREINYKMIGIMDNEKLITYAGLSILTSFKDKRHIKVFDLITDKKYDAKKYDALMKDYLEDYAKLGMCGSVLY
ncbi:MAG: GNAT family N-acetyltransferase [Campylobacterota bacterium]|nr:GNAT family N-acetyltransferase [Campylobacterota bacterium]